MRMAILALTAEGLNLAEKISARIGGQIFKLSKDLVGEIFDKFDALIFICAAGIAVRMIAPHIVSKLSDPAVIVIDERGQNVISLLSGHIGGANELTLKIAAEISANPIITTATDIENKIAVDSFAGKLGLRPEPKSAIKAINAAVLRDEPVYLTAGEVRLNLNPQKLIAGVGCKRGTSAESISQALTTACALINQPIEQVNFWEEKLGLRPEPKSAIKAINAAVLRDEPVYLTAGEVRLNLNPQKLIAGVGCKRGTSAESISQALTAACALINQPVERINLLASVDLKREEIGLLETAKALNIEIKFFGAADLAKKITDYKLSESKFVKATIGVGNVCEAAALCCVNSARFALTKKSFDGVTVALIWEK